MNYIEQINLLHRIRRKDSLKPIEVTLYIVILDICNRDGWENPFKLRTRTLLAEVGVNVKTITAARNRLQQSGLITFKTKKCSPDCEYQILTPKQCTTVRTSVKFTQVTGVVTGEDMGEVAGEGTGEVTGEAGVSVLLYNKPKQKLKQKQIIPPPSIQILEPEEIKRRLLEDEYELQQFICLQYQFSAKNFSAAVQLFVGEKTAGSNELHKPYPEVLKQFKAWVAYHRVKLLKQFNEKGTTTGIVPVWRQQY